MLHPTWSGWGSLPAAAMDQSPGGSMDSAPLEVPPLDPSRLQATLFDFAIAELVRQHRDSFQPLWTAEAWAKFLIWLALNCGCSGDQQGLEAFAMALGPVAALNDVLDTRPVDQVAFRVIGNSSCQIAVPLLDPVPGWAWPIYSATRAAPGAPNPAVGCILCACGGARVGG